MAVYGQRSENAKSAAGRRAKKSAKKAIRKTHPATLLTAVLCLVLGIAAGVFFALYVSKNDRFSLVGESSYSVSMGAPFTYREEGVEAVAFGRDVSDRVRVETTLEKDAAGNYVIPTDKAGVYTITYTADCFKFGEKSPNGEVKRIRTFTVSITGEG